jgi:hypothetical protein
MLVDRLDREGGNAYGVFGASGIHFIHAPEATSLTGGSFCDTELRQQKRLLVVAKRVDLRKYSDNSDADLKLRREDEFLRSLPEPAKRLFAVHAGSTSGEGYYEYSTEFVHGYTASEDLFHGVASVDYTLGALESLFGNLTQQLYSFSHTSGTWSCQEPDVLSRAIRRFETIRTSTDPVAIGWPELLAEDLIYVNGTLLSGWRNLESWLLKSEKVRHVLKTPKRELCHGDLILDDIVSLPQSRQQVLIDPNGDATSRLYDVSKIYLSTLSFYEIFKYDRFACWRDATGIWLQLPDEPVVGSIGEIGLGLPDRLRKAGLWSRELAEPDGGALLLLNGLQNAALPMFHLLKHRAPARALAFFVVALIRLNQARAVLESGNSIPPETAIEGSSLRAVLR